jgi:hypothetical protein
MLSILGWPRWLYKRAKHLLLVAVYRVLVAARQVGVTPFVERLCERVTGRGHA